jgi:hypothetical protein
MKLFYLANIWFNNLTFGSSQAAKDLKCQICNYTRLQTSAIKFSSGMITTFGLRLSHIDFGYYCASFKHKSSQVKALIQSITDITNPSNRISEIDEP